MRSAIVSNLNPRLSSAFTSRPRGAFASTVSSRRRLAPRLRFSGSVAISTPHRGDRPDCSLAWLGLPGSLSPAPFQRRPQTAATSKAGAAKKRRLHAEIQPEPMGATTGRNHDGESNIAKCCRAGTLLAGDAKRLSELL